MRIASFLLMVVVCLGGCGDSGGGGPAAVLDPAAPATAASALLRWNEYDSEWVPPAKRAWLNSRSPMLAHLNPHHNGTDLFLAVGQTATIDGKFHYGDVRIDLVGEEIGLYVRRARALPGWTYVADATTDNDGRVSFPYPVDLMETPGSYYVRMVVYGDLTYADALVRVVGGSTPAVVFDIDGTLTTSDWEMVREFFGDFLDLHYVPRMYPGANKVATGLARQDVEIIYMTARPYWLTRESRRWLALKGFPLGMVITYPDAIPAMGEAVSDYKRDQLLALQTAGATFQHAFGNATTDITAYAEAGIPTTSTYIIGENAGVGGTVALGSYTDLYGSLVPAPVEPYRVALLIIDGLRPDALNAYLDSVTVSESALARLFGTSVRVDACETTAPSVTFSGNASIATGRTPAHTGMVANSFFDRDTAQPYGFTGSTGNMDQVVGIYGGEGLANKTLQCQTLYDQMNSSGRYGMVTAHMYYKGAEYLAPSLGQLLVYLMDGRQYDQEMMDKTLERLEGEDLPDLLTVYLAGLDHEAHARGGIGGIALDPPGFENQQLNYLHEVIDPQVARLESRLEELGLLDSTVWVICSDHGHRNVVDDDDHAVGFDYLNIDEEIEEVIEDSPYNDAYDFPIGEGDFDAHVGLNGGWLNVTLRNRETENWADSPRFVEDVIPVLGSIGRHRLSGELEAGGEDAVEEVLVRTDRTAPYHVVRPTRVKITFESVTVLNDGDATGSGEVHLQLRSNGKVFAELGPYSVDNDETIVLGGEYQVDALPGMSVDVECAGWDEDWWFFTTDLGVASSSVLNRTALPTGPITVTSNEGMFTLTFSVEQVPLSTDTYPELPDWGNLCPLTVLSSQYASAQRRIEETTHSARSGDIILLPRWRQGFYFDSPNAADHGSLYPEDSYQTFAVGGHPITQSRVIQGGSVVDIAPTVARILGIDLRDVDGASRITTGDLPLLSP